MRRLVYVSMFVIASGGGNELLLDERAKGGPIDVA